MASPETSRSVGTNVCDAIKQEFGDSPSIIRVRNLQHITKGPSNAWGQVGRPQPLLLSAGVYLEDTFGSSAKDDAVKADTVHYGILSKFFLECFEQDAIDSLSLGKLVTALWQKTTGWGPADTIPWVEGLDKPFLDLNRVTMLDLTVNLPKASLLGDGVSFSLTGGFSEGKMRMVAKAVRLLGLRVPTLIGVNPNERLARQVVVTDITVEDMWDGPEIDYVALEAAVVYVSTDIQYSRPT